MFIVPIGWDEVTAIYSDGVCLEIDHIRPLSNKGSDSLKNKQALCSDCNREKSNYTVTEFYDRACAKRDKFRRRCLGFINSIDRNRRRGHAEDLVLINDFRVCYRRYKYYKKLTVNLSRRVLK